MIDESTEPSTRLFTIERRLIFANGWTIDVHKEADGVTWYQRWPPGTERQSVFAQLYRSPTAAFNEGIAKEPYEEITYD